MALGMMEKFPMVLEEAANPVPMAMPMAAPSPEPCHCGVSASQYAGKGICCMWPVNKVEIHLAKMGFVDCK